MRGLLSMTSFGRGEHRRGERIWTVELRSVNHRFCDIKIRLPRKYAGLESRIKRRLTEAFGRGHVEATLTVSGGTAGSINLKTDLELARQYHRCLTELSENLLPESPPTLQLLAAYRDVIIPEEQEEDLDQVFEKEIAPALDKALTRAHEMRKAEGQHLKGDLSGRLSAIEKTVGQLEKTIPDLAEEKKKALNERYNRLRDDIKIDEIRFAQEVTILIDRLDVTEELVRLKSHLRQFENFLNSGEQVGRRLDFLLQEFLREVNTLASKISNAEVAHLTVEIKNEIEKMREQVQNIE